MLSLISTISEGIGEKMSKGRFVLTLAANCFIVATTLFATASHAQAYVNADLELRYAKVRTDSTANCDEIESRAIDFSKSTGGCYHNDTGTSDDTLLRWDEGSIGLKVELHYPGRGQVAKVEFHPLDEFLVLYDQYSDSDGIYVTLCRPDPYTPDCFTVRGPYASSGLVKREIDMADLPDGTTYVLRIWDDSGPADLIDSYSVVA